MIRGPSGSLKVLAAFLLSGALCTGAAVGALAQQTFNVTLRNFAIEGAPASVAAGQRLVFNVTNPGPAGQHNLSFDVNGTIISSPDPNVPPGATGVITLTAPTMAGTFRLFCPVGQHRANGMDVPVTVVAGATTLAASGQAAIPFGLAAAGLASAAAGLALRRRAAAGRAV